MSQDANATSAEDLNQLRRAVQNVLGLDSQIKSTIDVVKTEISTNRNAVSVFIRGLIKDIAGDEELVAEVSKYKDPVSAFLRGVLSGLFKEVISDEVADAPEESQVPESDQAPDGDQTVAIPAVTKSKGLREELRSFIIDLAEDQKVKDWMSNAICDGVRLGVQDGTVHAELKKVGELVVNGQAVKNFADQQLDRIKDKIVQASGAPEIGAMIEMHRNELVASLTDLGNMTLSGYLEGLKGLNLKVSLG